MTNTAELTAIVSLLDDIATSDAMMGFEDIDRLCEARERLAGFLPSAVYNQETNRYTPESE